MTNVKFFGPVYGLEVLEICSHKVSASLGRPYSPSIIDIHHALHESHLMHRALGGSISWGECNNGPNVLANYLLSSQQHQEYSMDSIDVFCKKC